MKGSSLYQRTGIQQALFDLGCPPIFIKIFFQNIEPKESWWYQRPQIEDALNRINSPERLNRMIIRELEKRK